MKRFWSEQEKEFVRENLDKTSRELAAAIGRPVQAVSVMISKMGLTREDLAPRSGIKSKFSDADIDFLRENIDKLTNREIAAHLQKTLTVVRNKIYELGLQRNEKPDEWSGDQVAFLVENYRTIGDVEIGELMNEMFPDSIRKFGRRTINKKRKLLGLLRSPAEIRAIIDDEKHKARCNTILRNSGSLHYKDGWVAMTLTGKNHTDQIPTFLKYPELIEFKRAQLKLNRALKKPDNDNCNNTID
ncbi:hypothetical protein SAMN05216327_101214 [Dyadobacter sp. SG02]|uniref:hypothetical protein n=1 Tax=Dyadobacter sp. SG02 TaxID=1855291 RepID=UPI0008C0586F|nr:hypothetical protein [Dyadobacter sp. SG02]SEI39635.1 hypothetical protein SAMN05216327_101214 [Dyadobacter sp. SG02]